MTLRSSTTAGLYSDGDHIDKSSKRTESKVNLFVVCESFVLPSLASDVQ